MAALQKTVCGGRVSAHFRELRRPRQPEGGTLLALPAYKQLDDHSCGFLAVLTVVRYFHKDVAPMTVLRIVRPSAEAGCGQGCVLRSLRSFGITAAYRDRLGLRSLARLIAAGLPVIVTVWPEDYGCDHWSVVRGVDVADRKIYLTNCEYTGPDGGMPWADFTAMWWPYGGGLVCRRAGP
jgi:hypothetical protein